MSIQLQVRVSALEQQVKELRALIDGLIATIGEEPPPNAKGPRTLCPKCHEQPNYYLHVKHCKGKKVAAI